MSDDTPTPDEATEKWRMLNEGAAPAPGVTLAEAFKASKLQGQIVDMQRAIEHMRDTRDAMVEYHKLAAELKFSKYQSLCNAGFTKEEALKLCDNKELV